MSIVLLAKRLLEAGKENGMKRYVKSLPLICTLFLLATLSGSVVPVSPVEANFVDDWIGATAGGGPMYYQGQQRGYFTGGSYSARWGTSVDPLVNISLPKVKGGCGGIDLFNGGVSFMDFDYLVKKLQNVLASAPSVAFDLALNVLCEPCSKIIKSFTAITDTLNGLQMDDCKASRAMVATIMKSMADTDEKEAKLSAIQSDFMQSSGMSNLYKTITDNTRANNDQPTSFALAGSIANCPADLKAIFVGNSPYVLANLEDKYGFNGYGDMLRGTIGDVRVSRAPDGRIKASYVKPCDDNDISDIRKFITGQYKVKDRNGACSPLNDANANLVNYVANLMTGIATAMRSHNALSQAQIDFINSSPVPIASVLKMAIKSNQEGSIIQTIAPFIATAYAYNMLNDFMSTVRTMMLYGRSLSSSDTSAQAGQGAHTCRVDLIEDAMGGLQEIYDDAMEIENRLKAEYVARANEYGSVQTMAKRYEEFDTLAYEQLARLFGPSLAKRVISPK
jgi:conjugative transfer pilus assembly protein TraH